jgi:hypothetical protein
MWIFGFYRTYVCVCAGAAAYAFVLRSVWLLIAVVFATRVSWFLMERLLGRLAIERDFKRHSFEFKQLCGPYGIRLVNKAENDLRIKKSLAEVFTSNPTRLKKNVEQLTVMDALYKAGMRPDADTYQLHDCKLNYGLSRLERLRNSGPA